jgi:hypothetical protein
VTIAVGVNEEEVVTIIWITSRTPTTVATTAGASSQRAPGSTDTTISSPPLSTSAPGNPVVSADAPLVKPSK